VQTCNTDCLFELKCIYGVCTFFFFLKMSSSELADAGVLGLEESSSPGKSDCLCELGSAESAGENRRRNILTNHSVQRLNVFLLV